MANPIFAISEVLTAMVITYDALQGLWGLCHLSSRSRTPPPALSLVKVECQSAGRLNGGLLRGSTEPPGPGGAGDQRCRNTAEMTSFRGCSKEPDAAGLPGTCAPGA